MDKKWKKRIVFLLAGVACIIAISLCARIAMFQHSKTLFDVNPTEVVAITVENTTMLTQIEITDPKQIKEIVNVVNGFTYTSSKKVPPATGSNYYITLKTESGGIGFEFWNSGVKKPDPEAEPGSSILYYGKTGYFNTLVTLADNATDPM